MDIQVTARSDGKWLLGNDEGTIVLDSLSDATDLADRWMTLLKRNCTLCVQYADGTVERFVDDRPTG